MIVVELNWAEVLLGAMAGVVRAISELREGRDFDRYGDYGGGVWERNVQGCCAEKACAKKFDRYHYDGGKNRYDFGQHQARHTVYPDGKLVLHHSDNDEDPFVLVTGRAPIFNLVGWLFGHEGKKPEYWDPKAKAPAFFVPQSKPLRPIEELLAIGGPN